MINILDYDTINKIAAGEVIERPASVVKELCENAIDAGAKSVTVEIKDGGKTLIRVTDNGCGIERSEVKKAFMSHATSKIKNADDLLCAGTLGFRGEALSSIAAVAKVEMLTKRKTDLLGTRYIIEGGTDKEPEDAGCPDGTTFLVKDLFFNTPARKKFLKSDASEIGYVGDFVEKTALSHPEVAFRFISQGKTLLSTNGNGNLRDVIYTVYGRETAGALIEINYKGDDISVSGFIGKPSIARGNRGTESYYINKRYIKSNVVGKAVEDAYSSYIMKHKYPFCVLLISVNHELVDVNVHPAKLEVRFENAERIYTVVNTVIAEAISKRDLIPKESDPVVKTFSDISRPSDVKRFEGYKRGYEMFEKQRTKDTAMQAKEAGSITPAEQVNVTENKPPARHIPATENEPSVRHMPAEETEPPLNQAPVAENETSVRHIPAEENKPPLKQAPATGSPEIRNIEREVTQKTVQLSIFRDDKEEFLANYKLIGQVFKTYWLFEIGDTMYMLDQHAAHEKVLYERLIKEFSKSGTYTQTLSPPVIVKLSSQEAAVLEENNDTLKRIGFEVENFGGNEYIVSGVPVNIPGISDQNALTEFLCLFSNDTGIRTKSADIDHRIATMACKAAVKGNSRISAAEANELIKELLSLENPFNCPHGRPVAISMTRSDIEKKFKRQL